MRIAIPCENANGLASFRSGHFGHAPYLAIVELDGENNIVSVESQPNAEHGEGGCGNVIDHVLGLGLDGILAAGMGRPPLMRFTQGGMTVWFENTQPLVGQALEMLIRGEVRTMTPADACRH